MGDELKAQVKVTLDSSANVVKKLQSELNVISKQLKLNVDVAAKQDKVNKSSTSGLQDQVKFNQQNLNIEKQRNVEVAKLNRLVTDTGKDGGIVKQTKEIQTGASQVTKEISKWNKETQQLELSGVKIINDYKQQERLTKNISNTLLDSNKLISRIKIFENENPKAAKEYISQLDDFKKSLVNLDDPVVYRNINKQFQGIQKEAESLGKTGRTVFGELINNAKKFASWFLLGGIISSAVGTVKSLVTNVVELDTSLVELQKVSDLTGSSLERFTEKAFNVGRALGRTGKDVIDATTTFKRAGYDIEESMQLASAALLTTNVGDGIKNVEEASSALIAVLKGFKMSSDDAIKITDAINETSNNAAIDFQNITEGLRRVSGTLGQTGSSLEQTIGLLTGGFGQLRDIEMVSSGLIMISQRKNQVTYAKVA